MNTFPRLVTFNTDCECNINCVTCRADIYRLSDEELALQNEKIEKIYLPILKNAELVSLNGCGEALASRHSRALIKAIVNKYPKIHFCLLTNGLLCDEFNCKELGISNRIKAVAVSLNAATKETYDKVVLNSDFDRVLENIMWLKQKVDKDEISQLMFSFIITSLNYKDIPQFIELGESLDVPIQFLHYNDWKNKLNYTPEFLAVHNPNHPEYSQYKKISEEYIKPYTKNAALRLYNKNT